ncbi:HAD family hydrolase [Flavobacterium ustbae]|uniref:HAD family hydrolase n=1 Tax=Flavobacterium ustbae TaxID=2488790 RepID=UPI000F7B16F4|nr:HAD-IA family hydrolase [Flavobacterium ustbae]
MKNKEAVIFDMDGVVINSEPFWLKAENEIFSSLGVKLSDSDCQLTKTMTTREVTNFWFAKYPWDNFSLEEVEQMVIRRVVELINTEDCFIENVRPFIEHLKKMNYKIGLATNAPESFISVSLERTGILDLFDAISSSEHEKQGKPNPAVYLTTAKKLNVLPEKCIVIEDSYHGMQAGKNAGMTVVAFTNGNENLSFDIADLVLHHYSVDNYW